VFVLESEVGGWEDRGQTETCLNSQESIYHHHITSTKVSKRERKTKITSVEEASKSKSKINIYTNHETFSIQE
jgi:hypothetical protein